MKTCTKCKITKELLDFSICNSNEDWLQRLCKQCDRETSRQSKQSENGVIGSIYSGQKRSSRNRGHSSPKYTRAELKEWLLNKNLFHRIYNEWAESGYIKELKPSVDRLRDNEGYSFDNIQLMTWGENREKSHADMRSGNLKNNGHFNGGCKAVRQYTLDGKLIAEYISIAEAHRQTKIRNISQCCTGIKSTANGFVWKYAIILQNE